MGFPENVLAQGEKVERSLHPHPLTVFGPTLLGVVLIALAVVTSWVTPDDATGNRPQWGAISVLVVLALALVVVPYLRWRTPHSVITSHAVIVRQGIPRTPSTDLTLSKQRDVSIH